MTSQITRLRSRETYLCQQCLNIGHYTFECQNTVAYLSDDQSINGDQEANNKNIIQRNDRYHQIDRNYCPKRIQQQSTSRKQNKASKKQRDTSHSSSSSSSPRDYQSSQQSFQSKSSSRDSPGKFSSESFLISNQDLDEKSDEGLKSNSKSSTDSCKTTVKKTIQIESNKLFGITEKQVEQDPYYKILPSPPRQPKLTNQARYRNLNRSAQQNYQYENQKYRSRSRSPQKQQQNHK